MCVGEKLNHHKWRTPPFGRSLACLVIQTRLNKLRTCVECEKENKIRFDTDQVMMSPPIDLFETMHILPAYMVDQFQFHELRWNCPRSSIWHQDTCSIYDDPLECLVTTLLLMLMTLVLKSDRIFFQPGMSMVNLLLNRRDSCRSAVVDNSYED